ncbi:hypothetical protein [Hyphomicrobium sp.]|uniref:hypothetical protein n=1 Tax=Hyphomicrobium sp. TaxID=82 RepID=UPI003F6F6C2E
MREETQKRPDRLHRLDLASWLPSLAVLLVLFGGLLAVHTTVRKERPIGGTVLSAVWRINQDTGQRYSDIHVALDNKAQVRAGSLAPALPKVGSRITLRKRAMLLGYTTYQWDGSPAVARAASPSVRPEPAPSTTPAPTPVSIP